MENTTPNRRCKTSKQSKAKKVLQYYNKIISMVKEKITVITTHVVDVLHIAHSMPCSFPVRQLSHEVLTFTNAQSSWSQTRWDRPVDVAHQSISAFPQNTVWPAATNTRPQATNITAPARVLHHSVAAITYIWAWWLVAGKRRAARSVRHRQNRERTGYGKIQSWIKCYANTSVYKRRRHADYANNSALDLKSKSLTLKFTA